MNYNNIPSNPIQKLEAYMKRKNYSQNTIISYVSNIDKIIKSSGKDCYHLIVEDFNNYIDSVIEFLPINSINVIISAGKLYLKYGLEKSDYVLKKFERPRKEYHIPDVLSQEEISQVIQSIDNIKQRAIIAFIYCHGLRISECINFKIEHFDKSRKIIKIVQSKGAKDRILNMNDDCRNILIKYWMKFNPAIYLFNGQNSDQYSETSIRSILKNALKKCNITKDIHVHSIRHSYACHLYENGVPIEKIKTILGHEKLTTTLIYTRISSLCDHQIKLII